MVADPLRGAATKSSRGDVCSSGEAVARSADALPRAERLRAVPLGGDRGEGVGAGTPSVPWGEGKRAKTVGLTPGPLFGRKPKIL